MASFDDFINTWVKTGKWTNEPQLGFQCTAWVAMFVAEFGGQGWPLPMRKSGGAKDWFEDFGNSGARKEWSPIKIANTADGFPMAGDIVVWSYPLGVVKGVVYGHVAISDHNNNPNAISVIEQNGGAGTASGNGSDAIRRNTRYEAPLGWIRIPAIYNKIHKQPELTAPTPPAFDVNSIINNFSAKWNNRLKPWSKDDGNTFGELRGLWYQGNYEAVTDAFALEIERLNKALETEKTLSAALGLQLQKSRPAEPTPQAENKEPFLKWFDLKKFYKDIQQVNTVVAGLILGLGTGIAWIESNQNFLGSFLEPAQILQITSFLALLSSGVKAVETIIKSIKKPDNETDSKKSIQ